MTEEELVQLALSGQRDKLDELIGRIQTRIYNLAVRMLWHPDDAEDATQEILVKIITNLSSFRGDSLFITWSWQIAVNHLLNTRKRRYEKQNLSFEQMGEDLSHFATDNRIGTESEVEMRVLVEEAKIGCMQAMLLCLKRDERAAYILGEVMEITDQQGAEIFSITPAAFRKRLSRARMAVRSFMQNTCGLANHNNPCRCHRRVNIAIDRQLIDPHKLLFASSGENAALLAQIAQMDELERAGALFRTHPQYTSPELLKDFLKSEQLVGLFDQFGHSSS